jgi:hypothetical protein
VEERCQAILGAAQEIVDGFMQEFKIRLMAGTSKQVLCCVLFAACWRCLPAVQSPYTHISMQ